MRPTDMIAKRPDDVKKFLAAWFETVAFFKHNKAETVRHFERRAEDSGIGRQQGL